LFPVRRFEQAKTLKICSIVDEHTRQRFGGLVKEFITADRFIDHLEELSAHRGTPAVPHSDNGPEFISSAVTDWAANRTAYHTFHNASPGTTSTRNPSTLTCVMNV